MPFNIVGLRTADDAEHGGALYPVLSAEGDRYLIEMEPSDGTVTTITATGLQVNERTGAGGDLKAIGSPLKDLKIDVYITDARVAIACEKYDKGGGFHGLSVSGLAVAAAANAVSHARAARRRKGKVLVGHVRYPWLWVVGARTKAGFGTSPGIRIGLRERTNDIARSLFLDLTFDKHTDPVGVAQTIAQRCAGYRLTHGTLTAEDRTAFQQLAQAPRITPAPKTYGLHTMPDFLWAKATTAYLPEATAETT